MKKTVLLLFLALTLPSFAASVDWKLNTGATSNYMVGKDGEKLTGTAFLLLASDVSDSFTSVSQIEAVALGSAAISSGVNTTTQTATSSKLTAPTEYTFAVLIYDSSAKSFYEAAATKKQAAYNLGADTDHYGTATQISFTAANVYASAQTRNTQSWTSVPEPSVALMGLLGLGMLLKRRRA